MNLRSKSPTSSLNDVPLREAFMNKQDLGEKIFGDSQVYRKAPDARNILTNLWSDLGKSVSSADESGQVKTLTDGFAALYKMQDNAINSATKIKALTSPTATAAREAYKDFINPMMKLDPNTRASLMPDLQEYIATEMPKTLNKQAVINAVTNNADSSGGLGWLMNKLYLNKATAYKTAGALGSVSNIGMPTVNAGAVSSGGALAGRSLSPVIGMQTPQQGALREMK